MGALTGLVLGLGLALVVWSVIDPRWQRPHRQPRTSRLAQLLASAGLASMRPGHVVALSGGACVAVGIVAVGFSGVLVVGLIFGAMAASLPAVLISGLARRRLRDHAASWPDAVDNLASAVRAGLSLPEALTQLGERGPEHLRPSFQQFGRDYQTSGSFSESLDRLKDRLADPVGDRVVEALRIARDVGGGDLGRVLRSLSGYLRDDARTRGEIESRQSWTVNGARLAVASPWLVLVLMSSQRDVVGRFATPAGTLILLGGAAACLVAYRLMLVIGRLPTERRILA